MIAFYKTQIAHPLMIAREKRSVMGVAMVGLSGNGQGRRLALVVSVLWGPVLLGAVVGAGAQEAPLPRAASPPALPDVAAGPGEPLWEVGLGAIGAVAPDYPASASYGAIALPLPLLVYRGDLFRLGADGGGAIVPLRTERLELGLSFDVAPGASSEDNAREGLPDLDPLLEVGPQIAVRGPTLEAGPFGGGVVEFALQTRVALSADFDDVEVTYRGLAVEPQVRYRQDGVFGPGSSLSLALGPVFATEELHDYFYEVEPRFARAGRAAFDAEAGYLGTELTVGASLDVSERLSVLGGVQLSVHSSAANAGSPLFEDEVTVGAFLGLSYSLFRSERTVARR